ncbi:MAG: TonB-dependent receptor [Opitutaceae bacterium]|nr:TonB-dependent receptor [Opitutaceae bacterium]
MNADSASTGYDLKLDYLPLRNLRINLGFTQNHARITAIAPFAEPANPNPTFLAAQQRFLAAGGNARSYIGTSPEDLSKLTGTGYVRYEFSETRLRGLWALAGVKYAGARNGQAVTINTTTGDATVTNTHVTPHFVYDLNIGYRRKLGRYLCDTKLSIANVMNDQDFYGASWQMPRTVRASFSVNF